MSKFLPFALLLTSLTASCTHSIHQVQVSGFAPYTPPKNGREIKAASEQFVVLGFANNTNYVNEAYSKLMDKCKRGNISGITTQFSTSHGFFSWTNKIMMKGLCYQNEKMTSL